MSRRRFLKYGGAGAFAVGGAAAAYYLYNTSFGRDVEVTIPSATKSSTVAGSIGKLSGTPFTHNYDSRTPPDT